MLYLLILLMAFSGVASAIGPETPNMTFTSSKEWLVANGADSALLTLRDNNNPYRRFPLNLTLTILTGRD